MIPRKLPQLLAASLALFAPAQATSTPPTVQKAGDPVSIDRGGIYIRATRLTDGSILAGYAAGDGADHVLRAARSTDSGLSWTFQGEVARAEEATHDVDNANLLQLPSGRILYSFRNHDRVSHEGNYTFYRLTVCASEDSGKTWKFLSQVDEREAKGVNGIWEPFLRLAKDGSVQVYYAAENVAADQDILMRVSNDGGATWSNSTTAVGIDRTSRDGMPGVTEIDDKGNLITVFENTEFTNPGDFSIDYMISHDDGLTWGERGRVYTARGVKKTAGAPQVINVGGTLVASFMTNEDATVPRIDGGYMKVVVSVDGGKNWSPDPPIVTGELGSHWPGLFTIDSQQFLALYSRDGKGAVSQMYQLLNATWNNSSQPSTPGGSQPPPTTGNAASSAQRLGRFVGWASVEIYIIGASLGYCIYASLT